MNAECIIASYKQFMKEYQPRWIFGNSVLYKMCKDYPTHEDSEINIGKIWLIGRSYAAAVERRKVARESNDDFYYNVVSKAMYVIHEKLGQHRTKERWCKMTRSMVYSTYEQTNNAVRIHR